MAQHLKIEITSGVVHGEMRSGSPMVVFSHGFGVKRDSRGMFTDIITALPKDWGYILFDYNSVDVQKVTLSPYSKQQQMLQAVLEHAHTLSTTVFLIGHSMGSITASLLASVIPTKVILLAPPVHGPRPSGTNTWAERPGAYYDGDTLIVPRKDGTTSIIPKAFFDEASKIDCIDALHSYSIKTECTIVQALEEDIIKNTDGYQSLEQLHVNVAKLHGNHNFDPPHRQGLIDEILGILGA